MKYQHKNRFASGWLSRFQQKAISWLLLVLLTVAGCIGLSHNHQVAAVETPPQQQTANTATTQIEQARSLYQAGNYTEAIQILQQALVESRSQENPLQQAMVSSNLALVYQQLEQWQQVETYVDDSLTVLQSITPSAESQSVKAQTLDIQARLQLAQGNAQQAAQTWQQAAAIYEEVGNQSGMIRSQINLAYALQVSGYYRRAVRILTELETTLEAQTDSITKVVGLRSLGNALLLVGNTKKAEEILQGSLNLAQSLNSRTDISAAWFSLGNLARTQADNQQALDYYQQAARFAPTAHQQIQPLLNQLSLLVETEAWSDIPPLLAQIEPFIAELPLEHSSLYAKINYAQNLIKLQQSETNFSARTTSEIEAILNTIIAQAQQIEDQSAAAYALIDLGRLYELDNQTARAERVTEQALIIAQNIRAQNIAYQGQWQLGRLYQAEAQQQQAISAYQQAVAILQSLRSDLVAVNPEVQFNFRESVEPVYREYVSLLLTSDPSQADLIAAREAIDSLQLAELENFFRATCLDAQPVIVDQITDRDDPTSAIIYPIVLEDRFEIIVKLPQQPLRHYTTPIENAERVNQILQRLGQSLTQRNSNETIPLAQEVYRWLIEPAAQDLANSNLKTLVFVLDSPLRNLPMSVLHDGQQYLVEKYAVALAPSLQLVTPRSLAKGEIKAITAGLTQARDGFPALQYVDDELNTIQNQVAETETLLDEGFTSDSLQEKIAQLPFPVVHLATHGQFSSNAESTFILTWDQRINVNQLDNLLRPRGLDNRTPIELLVLSACETLTGDERAALGLAGVAIRAGARSTLATLWQVDDEATAFLMGQFYQALSSSTPLTSKAEALRQAQLTLLQDSRFDRPYFWSPFVLVGNWL